jgi:SAM-dependent methyltransferase
MATAVRYDEIGLSYRQSRQPDPRIGAQVMAALGDAQTIVNVGAGPGSYEPSDRRLAAVEPSAVMLAQRNATAAPGLRAVAEALPFADRSFDAALAILTVHHWTDVARGLAELRRVAARIVILATAAERINRLWLTADYFPGSARARRPDVQPGAIAAILGGEVRIETVLVPRDCTDGFGEAYWARPEAYLDPAIRAGMSACSLLTPDELADGVRRLGADLAAGRWDERHGYLRELSELDTGHRLIIAT